MKRRTFLASLLALPAAAKAWALAPKTLPHAQGLYLHPDAFKMAMFDKPTRMDIIYGWSALKPDWPVTVYVDKDEPA